MDVIGSTILHEMLHWEYHIALIAAGEPLVDKDPDPQNWPEPSNGYNAYNTMQTLDAAGEARSGVTESGVESR
jgi:hypothetical protein